MKKLILRDMIYKKMHFINADIIDLLDKGLEDTDENQIYVFAQYFKPGRQNFVTCILDENQDMQYFTHKLVVQKRDEDVPNNVKEIRTTTLERTFDKTKSVFKDWREDIDETGINCINHDLELWHGDKFIKDADDLAKTADMLRKYSREIKNIFI